MTKRQRITVNFAPVGKHSYRVKSAVVAGRDDEEEQYDVDFYFREPQRGKTLRTAVAILKREVYIYQTFNFRARYHVKIKGSNQFLCGQRYSKTRYSRTSWRDARYFPLLSGSRSYGLCGSCRRRYESAVELANAIRGMVRREKAECPFCNEPLCLACERNRVAKFGRVCNSCATTWKTAKVLMK